LRRGGEVEAIYGVPLQNWIKKGLGEEFDE